MYNYQPPGQFGRQSSYGGFPGAPGGPPPGMGPPPSMGAPPGTGAAPGVSPPPGMAQSQSPLPARPGGLPPVFQPPANMPNINFNAPVIRLGMSAPTGKAPTGRGASTPLTESSRIGANTEPLGNRNRMGLGGGMEQQRQQIRDSMMALAPPTREEIFRTIFVGNVTEGVGGDLGMERILHAASGGKLRRWTRATDADGKACKFGFAEFEDAEGLETAGETLKGGVEVPLKRVEPKKAEVNGDVKVEKEDGEHDEKEVKKANLLVVVDEASTKYADEWRERRNEDANASQFRVDSAREELSHVMASIFHPTHAMVNEYDGDTTMQDTEVRSDPITGEVITIPITVEDELSDIPASMRETVAAEIAAFRDRSNRRDLERLRREEEMEALERQRNAGPRVNRLASPPLSAPSGPAGGANGIPLGPRGDRGVQGAPSGPKGFQGVQVPRDYQNGVAFVNGSASAQLSQYLGKEDEESDVDDEELERRRREKKGAAEEKAFLDYERRWLNRERSKAAAVEREKARDTEEDSLKVKEKEIVAKRLREWNDDAEATKKAEEYYRDRSVWLRNRAAFRGREAAADEVDRAAEERERAQEEAKARGLADSFLDRQANEIGERLAGQAQQREPARFKLSLGAAAAKAQQSQAQPKRRTVAEVEGLLEDEEEADTSAKRTLVPIQFDPSTVADQNRHLSDEDRAQAVRQLAAEIPTDKEGLWSWDVQWEYLDETVIREQLRPFVEKKIVELLGVQEQMLVEVVEDAVKGKKGPDGLVEELEGALDEDAEVLVKKLWRMIIFFSESEKRGLST